MDDDFEIIETTIQKNKRELQEKELAKRKEKEKKWKQDMRRTLSNDSAIRVFRQIMQACGYQTSDLMIDPTSGEVNTKTTIVMAARRTVWIELRQHMDRDLRLMIEDPEPVIEEEEEDDSTSE